MDSIRTSAQQADTPPFPRWYEDEIFFSLCSRQHILLGNVQPRDTAAALFGVQERGIKHDFPFNLDAFETNTQGALGSADEIIAQRTILPFFAPFQSESAVQAAVQAMKSHSLGSIKYRLGLLTGRYGAEHPLKACTTCMNQDTAQKGVAYWHLIHQFPGVIVCPSHGCLLKNCTANRRWSGRFQWTLPSAGILSPIANGQLSPAQYDALKSLATAASGLASIGLGNHLDPQIVTRVYRQALNITTKSRVSLSNVARSFVTHTSMLRGLYPLHSLPSSTDGAMAFIGGLIRSPRGPSHPLKHLVLIIWLFESFDAFLRAYQEMMDVKTLEDAEEDEAGPVSASKSANRLHDVAATGKPRPKVLKPAVRTKIMELLANGADKMTICAAFEITVSTVNKLLQSEPLVQQAWAQRRFDDARALRRKDLTALVNKMARLSAKALRERLPATYAWLYRNDKAWLLAQTAQLPTIKRGNHSKVDWSAKDQALRSLVEQSLVKCFGAASGLQLSKAELYALIPWLPSCLEKKDQYRDTRAFLATIQSEA